MYRYLILPISLLIALHSSSQRKLEISHLTGDFYIYKTYNLSDGQLYPANSMYMVTNKGVVLFDVPWDTTQLQPLLDTIDKKHHKKVILVIATHFHDDRTAGFDRFQQKGIQTWSSKQTLQLCKEKNHEQARFYFTKDTLFMIGNHSFKTVYAGAGHTKDNIVIWFEKEKILYGGCLIKSTEVNSLGNIADANLTEWPVTIQKLIDRYPQRAYVIPGHFGWSDKNSLEHTLKLLNKK
jgi:metallo-beta-lactamase class B